MSELSDFVRNNPPAVIEKQKKLCSRCGRELRGQTYSVVGFKGTFGHQCALQVCQGDIKLIKKGPVIPTRVDRDDPLPY